ncbi:MAG: hypothetical protein ACRCVT_15820 [Leadbetterella sp.]
MELREKSTVLKLLVSIFVNVGGHGLNQDDMKAVKQRQDGGTNSRNVENEVAEDEYDPYKEMKKLNMKE